MRGEQEPAPVDQANPPQQQPVPEQPQQPITPVPTVPTFPQQPGPIEHQEETTPPPPRERHYDWNSAISPMVSKMLQANGVTAGSVLLVDSVNNRTNGSINTSEATESLRGALGNNGKFTLVTPQQLSMAKQQLGLSPQDSLGTRSKAIGIARNVGAQYVLYSSANGSANAPGLQMQLMLVQTGEIIWSGKGAVQQQ
ncbi:penicillin-binding protein activator LpoB [Yokenella regensburgei]|uniref:penicillin-binding protein activator LpoB n=1 Tax=Yokenella regensburgei TaxID=158877 RepID=UPI003F5CF425